MRFRNDHSPKGERVDADIRKSREDTEVTEGEESGLGSQSSSLTQECVTVNA